MTFDDDFVRLSVNGAHRLYNVLVKDRWEWPRWTATRQVVARQDADVIEMRRRAQ